LPAGALRWGAPWASVPPAALHARANIGLATRP
jgi:hypothetical protein